MAKDRSQSLDALKAFHALLHEATPCPDTLGEPELDKFLRSHNESTDEAQKQIQSLLKKIKGQKRLLAAKANRDRVLKLRDNIVASAQQITDSGKEIAARLISAIDQNDKSSIAMLARKFDESVPEDLSSLKEDIAWLGELSKDEGSAPTDK